MFEQIKILNAMLALDDFTVEDLSKFADVKPKTVYTVLDRRRLLLKDPAIMKTGRRGGRPVRYSLRPAAV